MKELQQTSSLNNSNNKMSRNYPSSGQGARKRELRVKLRVILGAL